MIENEKLLSELEQLYYWFDIDYTRKTQKYNRLIALQKLDDSGENPTALLNALYAEAEVKRKRIQDLKEVIKDEKKEILS